MPTKKTATRTKEQHCVDRSLSSHYFLFATLNSMIEGRVRARGSRLSKFRSTTHTLQPHHCINCKQQRRSTSVVKAPKSARWLQCIFASVAKKGGGKGITILER